MIKVMFVCYGNICRSPMAEALFRDMIYKNGLADYVSVASAAVSRYEIGNPVYYETKNILDKLNISTDGMYSTLLKKEDLEEYDYIIGMDSNNVKDIRSITNSNDKKIFKLLDLTQSPRDIEDPWYTRDFNKTYKDIMTGLEILLDKIKNSL